VKTTDASHARYQALLQVLRTADRIWNASRLFFERWDLSPSQFNVLNLLQLHPEGLSQIELSRQLIMHRSNVTGLVDRLEQRGLVRRKDLATDRRAYRVVVTQAGDALLNEILPHYYLRADDVWAGMSPDRIAQMTTDLKQMAENAERIGTQVTQLSHEDTRQRRKHRIEREP
jgi:DNA-binding MarR family transcriptional regulator